MLYWVTIALQVRELHPGVNYVIDSLPGVTWWNQIWFHPFALNVKKKSMHLLMKFKALKELVEYQIPLNLFGGVRQRVGEPMSEQWCIGKYINLQYNWIGFIFVSYSKWCHWIQLNEGIMAMSISDCVFRSNSVLSALSIIDDFLMKSKLISSIQHWINSRAWWTASRRINEWIRMDSKALLLAEYSHGNKCLSIHYINSTAIRLKKKKLWWRNRWYMQRWITRFRTFRLWRDWDLLFIACLSVYTTIQALSGPRRV